MPDANKNKILVSTAISALILITIISAIVTYTRRLNTVFESEISSYLREISVQAATTLDKQIGGELNTIQGLGINIGANGPVDIARTIPALKKISDYNNFKRMGIIISDGTAYTTDLQQIYLGDRNYFDQSMGGQTVITDLFPDRIGSGMINVYSAPIFVDDEVYGVIYAAHNVALYQKTLDIATFDGRGYSYVVKRNGDVIVRSDHTDSNHVFDNISQLPDGSNSEDSSAIAAMKEHMNAGESGLIKFTSKDTTNYLSYVPLSVNDWYVLSVVPSNVVTQKSSDIMLYTLIMGIIVIMTFVLLFVYIAVIKDKSRSDLKKLAFVDPVTGAYNMNMFRIKAEELIHRYARGRYAVVQFDIDKFKFINDMYGYTEGNRTLEFIARVIGRNTKKDELFARMTNDFFVILIEYTTEDELLNRINTISDEICDRRNFSNTNFDMVLSIGIYIDKGAEISVSSMIDRAGIAQKTVKGYHRTTCAFYDDELRNKMLREKNIENEMHSALETGQFVVYYQPKYKVDSLRIIGGEALVRWKHPERGIIPPDEFIPLFEKNRFIVNLDLYVFERVCAGICSWMAKGLRVLPVSINISRIHLHDPNFLTKFKDIIDRFGIPPHIIEFEITESVVFDNIKLLLSLINQLHDLGFLLSMDDFGTGYSSLNMLKDIPVDILKLDKSFFGSTSDSLRSNSIVSSVISLAQSLGITVVAEGVEVKEQLDFLKSVKCDIVQGYYMSRPVPSDRFEEILSTADGENSI